MTRVLTAAADERLLKLISGRHAKLGASWYGDESDLLFKGLKFKSTPVTSGVMDAKAAWTLFGIPDEEQMENIMRGWLNR